MRSSSAIDSRMCSGCRSGEVGCRIITASGRYCWRSSSHSNRVLHDRQMRRLVARQLGRAHERHVAAERAAGGGDVVGVGGEDQAIERAGVAAPLRSCTRAAACRQQLQVLARNPLRSAAGGDHAEHLQASSFTGDVADQPRLSITKNEDHEGLLIKKSLRGLRVFVMPGDRNS